MASYLKAMAEEEAKERSRWRIHRDITKEPFYCHSGEEATSWRSILASKSQCKLIALGFLWYGIQFFAYALLANLLIYITFHQLESDTPAYPGKYGKEGATPCTHNELYDMGFAWTTDLSYRPFWLKAIFVDMMVTLAQFLPPVVLLGCGHTFRFINYTGIVGIMNIMKGLIQIMTVLPPARQGEACWELNFAQAELDTMKSAPFESWGFKEGWGMMKGCNDMIWSGHTSQSCLGMLFIDKSLRHCGCPGIIRGLLVVYFIVYMWAVLACRMHYSIDVFLATVMANVLYTHAPLRAWLWFFANHIVCNDPDGEESEDVDEVGYEDEDPDESMPSLVDSAHSSD